MAFNLDNYEQVKDRITRFYSDHADGRIMTELVNDPSSLGDFAAFKAFCYIGETLKATGYAMEQKGQGVNRDAWVENAETSAIGRALANMDYCGTLRPSREEMSKVGNESKMTLEQATKSMNMAANLKELQESFATAWRLLPEHREELTTYKDKRKEELK